MNFRGYVAKRACRDVISALANLPAGTIDAELAELLDQAHTATCTALNYLRTERTQP